MKSWKLTLGIALLVIIVIALFFITRTAHAPQEPIQPIADPVATIQSCYTYDHPANATEPYKVNETMKLNITGTTVFGTKSGTQFGPDMSNGYQGILQGTKDGNRINVRYSYTIEGSDQAEDQEYEITAQGLIQHIWQLKEVDNVLVPDKTNDPVTERAYLAAACE